MKTLCTVLGWLALSLHPIFCQIYTYDAVGRLTQTDFQNGSIIGYSYDPAGNLAGTAFVTLGTDLDGDGIADQWELRYFGNNSTITSGSSNPDADSYAAEYEYAFFLNPSGADKLSNLPAIRYQPGTGFQVSYTRPKNAITLEYQYEFSNNLQQWWNGMAGIDYQMVSTLDNGNGSETVTLRLLSPGNPSKLFMRTAVFVIE